ncbi:MAG: sulfatase-like hydrolase/transferase [bacterium]|nr:sulfatase-like hydrolase/transferase [bacterium]
MTSRFAAAPLIILLTLAGCSGGEAPDPETFAGLLPQARGKNLIVISFDALRADALGAYGDTLGASPNLDAFATRSLVCDRAYTSGQATPTSFSAAWTGRQPFDVFRAWQLQPAPTLAGVLQKAGYRTAAFLNNRQLDESRGFARGFDDYEVVYMPNEETFLDKPEAWLRENTAEPFFVWIHFISPHAPYDRRDMAERFYTPGYEGQFKRGTGGLGRGGTVDDPDELERVKELYTGEVFYADMLFGRLLATIEEQSLMKNSVVVLTADHGDEHMDHGAFGHRQVYDEVVRIPLFIHHPGVNRQRRTSEIIVNLDFLPTFAGLLGLETPPGLDGVDVRGEHDRGRPVVSTAMTNRAWFSMGVRHGDLKLIQACRGRRALPVLFDLVADPGELRDLARTRPRDKTRLAALMAELAGGESCVIIRGAVRGGTSDSGLTPEEVQQLRALGY